MIDQCEIIQDLLPLYVDSACSASSTAMIEEHLDNCPKCKSLYEKLCSDTGEEILKVEMVDVVAKHEKQIRKKRILSVVVSVVITFLILVASLFVATGFTKNPSVQIVDYSVSDDGRELTFSIGMPFTIAYVRGYIDVGGGEEQHYLDFYNTFGSIIRSWGAQFEYVLELDESDTEIYFNREDGAYELVLKKDPITGEWVRPTE